MSSVVPLIAALALAAPSQADEAAPRRVDVKAFEWDVGTAPIVLGETGDVPVTLTARLPDGEVLDIAPPILRASTGQIAPPRRTAPGQWETTFSPPTDRFPHVAILSAQVDQAERSVIGFVSVPLWGKGRLKVSTKPESEVVANIGNETFGPVTADKAGNAFIDVLAPPGPERAVAQSKDPAGNESSKVVSLGVPAFNRLALITVDEVAVADGTGEAQLLTFAVDKKGEPLFEAELEVKASVGGFEGEPLAIAPGVFRLRFRPGQVPTGEATVEVALPGAEASRASADVRLLSGPPVRAELAAEPASLTADDDPEVTVTARLYDQADNLVPRAAGRLDVSAGRIDTREDTGDEGVVVRWILPAQVPAEPPTLTARATTGEVIATLELPMKPGRPRTLTLDKLEPVVADGETAVDVVVRAQDRLGNAVLPDNLALAFSAGTVVGVTPDARERVVRARLVPDVSDSESFATLSATAGELATEQRVRVLPRGRARLLVGGGLAGAWNYGSLLSAGPDLSFLVRVPGFDGSLHAGLSTGYLVSLPADVTAPGGAQITRDHRAIPLHAEVGWRPLLTEDISAHLGGAAGMVFSDLELVPKAGGRSQRSMSPAVSAALVGGLAYRLGPGLLEADLRLGWAQPFAGELGFTPIGVGLVTTYRFGL